MAICEHFIANSPSEIILNDQITYCHSEVPYISARFPQRANRAEESAPLPASREPDELSHHHSAANSARAICGGAHPLREQVSHLLGEAHLAIKILGDLVVMAGLESQRVNPHLAADVLAKADDRLPDFLSAVRLAHIDLIKQSELTLEFKAEAVGEHKISDHNFLQCHQIYAAQTWIEQGLAQRRARDFFLEAHLRNSIELSHQLDGSGQIAIGDQLEVGVH